MIQLIEKQPGKYTLKIHGLVCVFMPMCLFCGRSIIPLKPFVPKGKSVIKWKVNGKQVSYNQIKKAMKTEQDFLDYITESRNEFCTAINRQDWNTQLRTAAESLLICFDQMKDRLEETTLPPA